MLLILNILTVINWVSFGLRLVTYYWTLRSWRHKRFVRVDFLLNFNFLYHHLLLDYWLCWDKILESVIVLDRKDLCCHEWVSEFYLLSIFTWNPFSYHSHLPLLLCNRPKFHTFCKSCWIIEFITIFTAIHFHLFEIRTETIPGQEDHLKAFTCFRATSEPLDYQ